MRKPARSFLLAMLLLLAGPIAQLWLDTSTIPHGVTADRLELHASERLLLVFRSDREIARFRVALGPDPLRAKERQGDGRTPHGRYVIDFRNPGSAYHLALHVSYPDADDANRARARGEDPGGDIMIHGLPNRLAFLGIWQGFHRMADWTQGCIALTDREMDDLWRAVPDGTPISIGP